MKKINQIIPLLAVLLMVAVNAFSEENVKGPQRKANPGEGYAAGCAKSTNIVYMDLNNVRCPILMNGDMWWDAINDIARYEIPKGSGKTSDFAGAIWIGGLDNSGNLKLAAQTYRQSGVDFWPGPLDTLTVSTDANECLTYDRHWKLLRSDVQAFVSGLDGPGKIPEAIMTWPGTGNASKNEGHYLAPFVDVNNDGVYNYQDGDYPGFDLSKHPGCGQIKYCGGNDLGNDNLLFGDQNIWWVFNDEGNIHTETGGAPIGLEIRAQAFCFQTNDDINNCTFYNYQVINRSTSTVNDTWFGAWNDFDLGYAFDDYTGCDVGRGLGYGYNGEAFDPGTFGYGYNPPCIGQVFFQGPLADPNDGIDNNRNGVIDEPCEQIIMSQFVYYVNNFGPTGNPLTAENYYNYLKGIWIDGTPITYGGNGHGGSTPTSFMFPGNTDPCNWGINLGKGEQIPSGGVGACTATEPPWSEVTAGDVPDDRRFLQSAGKFTLKPGAVNYITTGVVWARATSGGPDASIPLTQAVSDDAQALFNACFALTNGPDAPDVVIRELNQELIISIHPDVNANDSIETNYSEKDPYIKHSSDATYHFQGYQVFQFANSSVTINDVGNPSLVAQIAQCDIKDTVAQLVNSVFNAALNSWVATEEVNGANLGLQHTFDIKTDAFAPGASTTLINHQTYYFCVIAYAYNSAEVTQDCFNPNKDGHCQPYISGRRNVFTYAAIPHIPDPQDGGLVLNSQYGSAPMIQRLEGRGNGGLVLDMTQASINQALSSATNYQVATPYYQSGNGPIDVEIYDPVKVGNNDFLVYLQNTSTNSKWYITETTSGVSDSSDQTIAGSSEKIFPQWGISVNVQQVSMAGQQNAVNNGFLEGTMQFTDPTLQWLTGVPTSTVSWLYPQNAADTAADLAFVYEKILNGTWGPFLYGSNTADGPVYGGSALFSLGLVPKLDSLASVDIVLTSDKSLWSRSVVIEEQANPALAEGEAAKGDPRLHPSVDKNGLIAGQPGYNAAEGDSVSATGMGWFPGYAINLETGERLNIMFGENSYLVADNGNDMLFNPSANISSPFGDPLLGGMHYIYIMGRGTGLNAITVAYDNCSMLKKQLDLAVASSQSTKKNLKTGAWRNCMWVGLPLLSTGYNELATDVKIRLRVAKSYQNYNVQSTYSTLDSGSQGIPYYHFNTSGLNVLMNQTNVAHNALDLINIVPNPYYSYSSYEINQLDNRVKIVNLPNNCTVSIFTQNGLLVRKYYRNIPSSTDLTAGVISQATTNNVVSTETNIDWDLKNSFGVPVAGGVYIIHIDAPGLGERVIKWFGVIRPLDLQTF